MPVAAVALLGDDHFGLAGGARYLASIPRTSRSFSVSSASAVGLDGLEIIILAIDEEHDVGVLLDRARFPEVRQLRPLVLALLDRAAELRQADHRHVELLRQLLEAAADLRDFLDAIVVRAALPGALEQLQIVDDDSPMPFCRLSRRARVRSAAIVRPGVSSM